MNANPRPCDGDYYFAKFAALMTSFSRSVRQLALLIAFTVYLFQPAAWAQEAGGHFFLSPMFSAGITAGHDYAKGMTIDFGNINRTVGLELRGGYWLSNNLSLFTGFGYSSYHYRLVGRSAISGPDTIRTQSQEYWEVPFGVRVSTYRGARSVHTRFYAAAGVKACFLDDARHDYQTANAEASEANVVRPQDFNKLWLRWILEGGIDIPMDYGSAIIIGLNMSSGLSRNTNTDGALSKDNPGVFAFGGSLGLRIGLTPYRPVQHHRR